MEFLNRIQEYINKLDQKRFIQYSSFLLGGIILIVALLMFHYYWRISGLKKKLETVQEQRDETKVLLKRAQKIKQEKKKVDDLLAKDRDFKISGYFKELIGKLGLTQKLSKSETVPSQLENKYLENILTATFTGMTMKELTELLQEFEITKRIYMKELIISRSETQENSIDVTLVAATLEPKPQESSE